MNKADIINALWFGNLNPQDFSKIAYDSEYSEMVKAFEMLQHELKESLSPEQKSLFETLLRANDELSVKSELDCFEIGFKLGAELVIQVLQ